MRYRRTSIVVASAIVAAACTAAGSTPATAPPTPETTTTATVTPSTAPTTTVDVSTTTTVDRLSEIQAIFEDLERRRLQAIYDQDEAAFRSLYANEEYMKRSLVLLDSVSMLTRPNGAIQNVVEVLSDTNSCIAAVIYFDNTGNFVEGGTGESIHVIEKRQDGTWGLSWIGTGWTCDGPHPFS